MQPFVRARQLIRQRARKRAGKQPGQPEPHRVLALAAAAIAAVALAACGSAAAPGGQQSSTPGHGTGSGSSTSQPTSSPASSSPASQGLAGFQALSMTFVSDQQGFALGTVDCGTAKCLALLSTANGGTSWRQLTAPTKNAGGVYSTCPAGAPCAQQIRFATPQIGYAYDPSLLITTDGGSSWQRLSGTNVSSLETADGNVVRVVSNGMGCSGQRYQVQTAAVGSTAWHTLQAQPFTQICPPVLYRQGQRLVLAAYGNPAGGVRATAQIGRSANGGATWASGNDQCGGKTGYASGVALCTARRARRAVPGPGARRGQRLPAAWVRVSTNGGATFGPDKIVPSRLHASYLQYQLAAARDNRLLVVETGQHGSQVLLTENGGASWSSTLSLSSTGKVILVGYQDPLTCRVAQAGNLWTSTTGGQTWQQQHF